MDKIDLAISKECMHCGTKTPLHFSSQQLVTLGEYSRMSIQVNPDEFHPCPVCGGPLHLSIQAQPYELVNHIDETPIARQLYQQQLRGESEKILLTKKEVRDEKIPPTEKQAMPLMRNPNYLSEMFGNREDRTTAEIIEIAASLKDGEAMSCDTSIWPDMKLTITIDNQLDLPLIDVKLDIGRGFHFKQDADGSYFHHRGGEWHYSGYMTLRDIVQSFRLEDSNLINPDLLPPGAWSGWRIISFGTPIPRHLVKRVFPVP